MLLQYKKIYGWLLGLWAQFHLLFKIHAPQETISIVLSVQPAPCSRGSMSSNGTICIWHNENLVVFEDIYIRKN